MYFQALHFRLHNLYNDYGHTCTHEQEHATILLERRNRIEKAFQFILNKAKESYKKVFDKGSYSAEDIVDHKPLIDATYATFKDAMKDGLKDGVIPTAMRNSLDNDVYVFSALKTHAQLYEASRQITDENGKMKSFEKFAYDVEKLGQKHNEQYLEAEYRFAKTSATSAGRWAAIEADGDAFNLQYRTAGDDRVRDSHAALDMITLPPSDPFWSSFSFPNGWRCRCSYVQVRKSKYPLSDSAEAIRLAEEATTQIDKDGKNRLEIFRFNPGKDKVIFPPHHPYRKVQDADKVIDSANYKTVLPERYKDYNFKELSGIKDGRLVVFSEGKQNVTEFTKNKAALTILADEGGRYIMLPAIEDNKKNPDAFNLLTNKLVDVKVGESPNAKSVVQNAMKDANKQKVPEVVIRLTNGDTIDAIDGLRLTFSLNRCKNVKTVVIIDNNDEIKTYQRDDFK